ncbi:MAG TPA: winged helix-turn-helix domain-containing protein [Terriglobales bacterium]|nr:winged helix-turn-helix domain-containing protein [Terriglobales bacterium]
MNPSVVRFGVFELDLRAGELRKSGVKIKLQDQPLQVLTMLLESPGQIVTREDLQKRLWPEDTFVDFDLSLNSAVKKLRQALGDDSDNPRFIETLYRRGYRFIGAINGHEPGQLTPPIPVAPQATQNTNLAKPRLLPVRWLAFAFVLLLMLAATWLWQTRPLAPPRVTGYTQITHDGLLKYDIFSDGERLYFVELQGDHFVAAQVSAHGGESSILPIPFRNVALSDVAKDGSAMLVGALESTDKHVDLWAVPLPPGAPQRIGDVKAIDAVWSKSRDQIAYSTGSEVYLANSNGTQSRKIANLDGSASDLVFAPDGQFLRFSLSDSRNGSSALWQVNLDGGNLHPLLPGWNRTPQECCGKWTPDGKYYVFQSFRDGRNDLWVLSERHAWTKTPSAPVQLTNGPLDFGFPTVASDGKKVFAVGVQPRSELVRYDGSGFSSYMGGMSATDLAFSPDGQWVAYVSVPGGSLWRSKLDGSERLQLTDPSFAAGIPRWSPDGTQIVFMGRTVSTGWRTYLISSTGGEARDLIPSAPVGFDPNWSPDGRSIVLTLNDAGGPGSLAHGPGIVTFELATGKITPLPGATNFFSPRWSPDGKYIAAITDDSDTLVLFNRATGQWSNLVKMPMGYPSWSHDSQYLYFDTTLTDDAAFFRVRISDGRLERLVSLKGFRRYWGNFSSWTGLAPDDSPLLVRDVGSQEIYSLDWQLP